MGSTDLQYDKSAVTDRQIRTTKRSTTYLKCSADESASYMHIMTLETAWEPRAHYVLRVAQNVESVAIGDVLHIRNRETGLDLGISRVLPFPAGDMASSRVYIWDLCAVADARAVKGSKTTANASQPVSQPAVTLAVTPAVVPARRVSERKGLSAFTRKPATAGTKRSTK
jgi:hypothetical protein